VATGVQRRLGKIELADGGTLFLDEVGDLSLPLQAKLLRVVQEREFERLGGRERIPVDIHLITATNRDLEDMVDRGRVSPRPLLPPERGRGRGAAPCASGGPTSRCWHATFSSSTVNASEGRGCCCRRGPGRPDDHAFPGNVRELENAIQAAIALAPGETISVDDLRLETDAPRATVADALISLDEVERRHIERVLQAVAGNRQAAARILGIDRTTLYRKLRQSASPDAKRNNP
jgi:Nif-specific regulatory protein